MTTTQIEYWKLQETKKHNRASEDISRFSAYEDRRHHISTENETRRHNVATEALTANQLDETIRHNKKTEALSVSQLSETVKHNRETEKIQKLQADASYMQALTQRSIAPSTISANTAKAKEYAETAKLRSVQQDTSYMDSLSKTGKAGKYAALAYGIRTYLANANIGNEEKEFLRTALSAVDTMIKAEAEGENVESYYNEVITLLKRTGIYQQMVVFGGPAVSIVAGAKESQRKTEAKQKANKQAIAKAVESKKTKRGGPNKQQNK